MVYVIAGKPDSMKVSVLGSRQGNVAFKARLGEKYEKLRVDFKDGQSVMITPSLHPDIKADPWPTLEIKCDDNRFAVKTELLADVHDVFMLPFTLVPRQSTPIIDFATYTSVRTNLQVIMNKEGGTNVTSTVKVEILPGWFLIHTTSLVTSIALVNDVLFIMHV
jgi:hypothetical protein